MARRPSPIGRLCAVVVGVLLWFGAVSGAAANGGGLVPLVRDLPWDHVSGLIAYDGRMWFVNSRKFVNHNSADIYSYDPDSGRARYERHLFSQDAGDPVVSGGLLYWPFEDSRWSPGRGEYMVTDGRRWRWGLLRDGQAFHVHAMAAHDGALYAAPSAWRALVERSTDGGTNWKVVYRYPAPDRTVSRIVTLHGLGGALYAGVSASHNRRASKLLKWSGAGFAPVKGWPAGTSVPVLQAHDGWLYGDNVNAAGGGVWRTDGKRVERVTALDGHNIAAFTAGQGAIWAVSGNRDDGALWRSRDGMRWTKTQDFKGIRPVDVELMAGRVYVGARGAAGGVLLGPPAPAQGGAKATPGLMPRGRAFPTIATEAALAGLDEALAQPSRQGALRRAALPLALSDDPAIGTALARRIAGKLPDGEAGILGGRIKVPAASLARWNMMWAMAHNGHGRVPPSMIGKPWTQKPNRAEKYIDPPPGAAWAASELGQSDPATIAALIARLDRAGDPKWLTGDMIGALTALTGKRYAYDIGAWRRWWKSQQGKTP